MGLSIVTMMILKATHNLYFAQFVITTATIFAHYLPVLNALYYIWQNYD